VYAFRKVALGLEPTSPPPTDPRGEWFFEKLYEEALQAYRRGKTEKDQERQQYENAQKHRYFLAMIARRAHDAGETLPAGMRDDDPRWAAAIHKFAINPQFQAQDRERARLRDRFVGDGRNPNGSPTPEAVAFVELCVRQATANLTRFVERNPLPSPPGKPVP